MESKSLESQLKYGPDFICIGAQKSCTSWLHWNLYFHPDTAMPPEKELNYFGYDFSPLWKRHLVGFVIKYLRFLVRNKFYYRRYTQWFAWHSRLLKARKNEIPSAEFEFYPFKTFPFEWYEDFLFSPHTLENYPKLFPKYQGKISGDLSPSYAVFSNKWVRRLSKTAPTVKIIYLLRNPIERTWSQFKMENKDFLLTNPKESEIIECINDDFYFVYSYYTETLNKWESYFPGRVKVWFYDEVCNNPEKVFIEICEYLDIAPDTTFSHNKIKSKVFEGPSDPIPTNVRRYLNTHFKEELLSLHKRFNNVYTKDWLNCCTTELMEGDVT